MRISIFIICFIVLILSTVADKILTANLTHIQTDLAIEVPVYVCTYIIKKKTDETTVLPSRYTVSLPSEGSVPALARTHVVPLLNCR